MPEFTKGIKVNYDKTTRLWRIVCHVKGARWSGGSRADKGEAIAIAQDLAARLLRKEDIRPRKFRQAAPTDVVPGTVRDIGDRWLVEHAKTAAGNTTQAYDNALRGQIYPLLGDVAVTPEALTRAVCTQFARDLIGRPSGRAHARGRTPTPLAFGTRQFACNVLSILCEYAFDKGLLAANPAKKLGKHTRVSDELDKPIVVWTHAQAAALLTVTKAWAEAWYLPLKFAIKTGVRSAELIEIRATDQTIAPARGAAGKVKLERQYLSKPRATWTLVDGTRVRTVTPDASRISPLKGRAARTLDVWADLWAELEADRKAARSKFLKLGRPQDPLGDLLFTSPTGQRLDLRYFARKVLPGLCRRAGIPVSSSIHATRHTFATVLLTAGEPLRYVSEQLGHKNESLTETVYKHWIPDHRLDVDRGTRVAAAWGAK